MYFIWTTPCFKAFRVPNTSDMWLLELHFWDTGRNTISIVICREVAMQNKLARNPYIINTCNCWLKPLFKKTISFIFLLPEALKGLWLKLLSFAGGKFSSCYYFPSFHLASFWNSSKLHGLPHSWFLDFMSPYFNVFFSPFLTVRTKHNYYYHSAGVKFKAILQLLPLVVIFLLLFIVLLGHCGSLLCFKSTSSADYFFCSNVVLLCQLDQFDSIIDLSELDSPLLFHSNSIENYLFFWLALAKIRVETPCPFYSFLFFFFLSLSQHWDVVFACNSLLSTEDSKKIKFPLPPMLHPYRRNLISWDFNANLHISFCLIPGYCTYLVSDILWNIFPFPKIDSVLW